MAEKKKQGGLGRGLSVLFEEYNVEELGKNGNEEISEQAAKSLKKENKSAAVEKSAEKMESAEKDGAQSSEQQIETAVILIDINDIKPNESQPRKSFDAEKISELADSIKEHGVIQPLIARRSKSGYELVAGERRWRAAREAGIKKVPCIIRELTDQENMLIAIIENMQRENLNPLEEAEGINQMIKTYGLTQEQVSKSLGKSRPYITNSLRILTLTKEVLDSLARGEITSGHARALLSIQDKKRQASVFQRIIRENLSVRDVERIAQGEKPGGRSKRGRRMEKSRDVLAVEQDLKEIFGTKVSIVTNGRRGAIEFEYYSIEELNRLIDLLKTVK